MGEIITAYKGFDKDLKCRGFQFEIGKEYEEPDAKACRKGFHACEMPLDVFRYYPPNESRYCIVEQSGKIDHDSNSDDTKTASTKIKIGAEIGIPGLIKAQIEWVKSRAKTEEGERATGDQGAAYATGFQGAAYATGFQGAAYATGFQGAASATGFQGAASATGDQGAAYATGRYGAAYATGFQGAASATGFQGAASATGDQGAASATGDQGAASATGDQGAASATGRYGAASATGFQGAASATGFQGAASATGLGSVALASGYAGKVMGAIGCAIVCCERGEWDGNTYPLLSVASAIVDGEKIKPDTWYTVKNGVFVEAD